MWLNAGTNKLRCIGELLLNLVSLAGIVSEIYDMLWLPPSPSVYNTCCEASVNLKEFIRTAMLLRYQLSFALLNDCVSLSLTNQILWNHKLILCRFWPAF